MEQTQVDRVVDLAADLAGKADIIDTVLILYTTRDTPGISCMDNKIDTGQALFLIERFRHWLMSRVDDPKNSG